MRHRFRAYLPENVPPRRAWRRGSADRLAGGTCSGRCHGLKAHQAQFSAGNRTIHQRGVETSSREHCVAGAEAEAATVSCRDWECKHRPAARAQAFRTGDEEALFRCTCVNAPTDRTTEPQPPHRHEDTERFSHGLTGLAAVAEQSCRLGLVASTCHTSQNTLAAGAKQRVPVRDAEGRVLLDLQLGSLWLCLPPSHVSSRRVSCVLSTRMRAGWR